MAELFDIGIFSAEDIDGSVGVGWKLTFYQTGTSTKQDTYPTEADADAGTNANTNPVLSDSAGRFPPIWMKTTGNAYKVTLSSDADVVKVTRDPAIYSIARSIASTASSKGAGLIGFSHSATYPASTVGDTLQHRFIVVTDHPYLCDSTGVTACGTALATLASDLASAPSAVVRFPAGTYLVDQEIAWPSNVTLEGDGPLSIIKLANGVDDHLFSWTTKSGITIRNLLFDGNKANQTSGAVSRCLYFIDCDDVRIEDVRTYRAADHGIHVSIGPTTDPLADSSRIWLTRVKANDCGTDVLTGNGGSGIVVTCAYLWATDCYAEGNLLAGFKFTGRSVDAKGCYAINNDAGGFTTGFDSVSEEGSLHVYTNCQALNNGDGTNGGDGFRHQGQVDRIIHRDCVATGNAWSGISLVATSTVKPTEVDVFGGYYMNNGQNFTPDATTAGSGISILSTSSSPNIPSYIRVSNATITDDQGTKTQTYGIENQDGTSVYIGEGTRLDGNKTSSFYNAATIVTDVRMSSKIMDADFITRTISGASVTGTTSETDLKSITIPANTLVAGMRFRVRARGTVSGTNGTKQIRLYFGSANTLLSSQTAGETQEWVIDAYVEVAGAASQKVFARGSEISGTTTETMLSSTSNANTAITCKVTGTLGNTGDTITCSSFSFAPAAD